jgi:hypothetical protein
MSMLALAHPEWVLDLLPHLENALTRPVSVFTEEEEIEEAA